MFERRSHRLPSFVKGQRAVKRRRQRQFQFVTGKYQVKNNRRLTRQLNSSRLRSARHPHAAAFIGMHGDGSTGLWAAAETPVKCADRNPHRIDQATKALEDVLRREGLDQGVWGANIGFWGFATHRSWQRG
jgi:hypothetical protein